MAVEIGTASSYLDLLDQFRRFITGTPKILSNTFSGVGSGALTELMFTSAAVTETWTITCTKVAPGARFSVVGSVSGEQDELAVGSTYSNPYIRSALVTQPTGVPFALGDKWTISVEQGVLAAEGSPWAEERWDDGTSPDTAGERSLYLRGPGAGGTDAIHVQICAHRNEVQDWYNWKISGASGFNPNAMPMYTGQPGFSDTNLTALMLWNQAIPYWFVANGRRFVVVAKISTVYQSCYGGFILPYALPSEYPYPLAIGGSYNGDTRWSNDTPSHLNWTNPNATLRLRQPDGNWLTFGNYYTSGNAPQRHSDHNVWPTAALTNPRPAPDGTYSLNPLILHTNGQGRNVYGEFQGVRRISGYGNASENTVEVDGVTWLVVQDGFRTGSGNYFALALE